MNISICPTVTAVDAIDYERQIDDAVSVSTRIHIDAADGDLAPRKLMNLTDIWWPGSAIVDLHIMYRRPLEELDVILALRPRLVIAHAEATGDFKIFSNRLRAHGIEAGVALLPDTPVSYLASALAYIDHVLIFSGNLGYQGGSTAHLDLLAKAAELRTLKPQLEIGWDGGVNEDNIAAIARAGVEVINVGGYLQKATDKHKAYATLQKYATDTLT